MLNYRFNYGETMATKKKTDDKIGTVFHIRLRKSTEELFKKQAKKMSIPTASYIRIYIEDTLSKHKEIVGYERTLTHV